MDSGQKASGVYANPTPQVREAVDYNNPVNCPYEIDEPTQKRLDNEFRYHSPNSDQADRYPHLRSEAKKLAETICRLVPDSRERSVALRKLREATMYANAGIACNE